jgi:hypothetical protein
MRTGTAVVALALLAAVSWESLAQTPPRPQPQPCRSYRCQDPVEREIERAQERTLRTVFGEAQRALSRAIREATR